METISQFSYYAFRTDTEKFIKYALRSLNFSEPIPSYESRCALLNLKTLSSRSAYLACSFVANLLNGSIDCPNLLERITFNVPIRNLRSVNSFYISFSKSNYAKFAPLMRTLAELNNVPSFDPSLSCGAVRSLLYNYFN